MAVGNWFAIQLTLNNQAAGGIAMQPEEVGAVHGGAWAFQGTDNSAFGGEMSGTLESATEADVLLYGSQSNRLRATIWGLNFKTAKLQDTGLLSTPAHHYIWTMVLISPPEAYPSGEELLKQTMGPKK